MLLCPCECNEELHILITSYSPAGENPGHVFRHVDEDSRTFQRKLEENEDVRKNKKNPSLNKT